MIKQSIDCKLLHIESQVVDAETGAPMVVDYYWISFPVMPICLGPFKSEKEAITCLMQKLIKE